MTDQSRGTETNDSALNPQHEQTEGLEREPANPSLSNLPVQLTLTVGSVTLPLEQLISMSEGQTYTDEVQSFFPSVRLYASDRLVAEGELVRVDGRIGFRVTRICG
ncbi:MAG: Type flagellar switch regulator (C-ring) FliN C-term [Pseudomonadota bacterium]